MQAEPAGNHEKIDFSLRKVNLKSYFNQISSASEVKEGKPAPDLFLLAANKLGLPPNNCLVIEDSINGIIAAQKAGMGVVAFPGSFAKDKLMETKPSYVTDGYSDLLEIFKQR